MMMMIMSKVIATVMKTHFFMMKVMTMAITTMLIILLMTMLPIIQILMLTK